MKMHAFKVMERSDVSFDDVMLYIKSLPIDDRLICVAENDTRLERLVKENSEFWCLDFTKIRRTGPGKSGRSYETTDFDLAVDEGFGEQTAAIYHVGSRSLILQYNHYGPRISTIVTYLFHFASALKPNIKHDGQGTEDKGFQLNPIMKSDMRAQLDSMKIAESLSLQVHIPELMATDDLSGKSLAAILGQPLIASAGTLKLEIKADKTKNSSLSISALRAMIGDLFRGKVAVTQAKIRGRENLDSSIDVIDLLESRLEEEVDIKLGGRRRIPAEDRWKALFDAYYRWSAAGLLQ